MPLNPAEIAYLRSQPIEIKVRFPNPGDAPSLGEVTVESSARGTARGGWP